MPAPTPAPTPAFGAGELEETLALSAATLRAATASDWSVLAGELTMSCRDTAVHIGGCCLMYAAQLAGRATNRYVPFRPIVHDQSVPEDWIEVIEATGALLVAAIRTAPTGLRAWHPHGTVDASGFAAMGAAEVLLHTDDIARSLHLDFAPPAHLCTGILRRRFPDHAAPRQANPDPWTTLRWATGRTEIPGRPHVTDWRYSRDG